MDSNDHHELPQYSENDDEEVHPSIESPSSAQFERPEKVDDTPIDDEPQCGQHMFPHTEGSRISLPISADTSDSLFIPEDESIPSQGTRHLGSSPRMPPPQRLPTHSGSSSNMPPPPRPSSASGNNRRVFDRIVNMHRKLQNRGTPVRDNMAHSSAYEEIDMFSQVEMPGPSSSATPAIDKDEDEEADKRAREKFLRQKRYYDVLRERANGALSFRHDVQWIKIQMAEDFRLKKRQRELALAQQAKDNDEFQLFPIEPLFHTNQDEDDSDGPTDSYKRPRREMPRKQSKEISIQDAELESMQVALNASRDNPKKKRVSSGDDNSQSAQSSSKGKGKGKGKAKAQDPKPKKATKQKTVSGRVKKSGGNSVRETAKSKREKAQKIKQMSSLLHNDVFQQQAGAGAREQPTFTSKIKAAALKELIASVPSEHQKKARGDMSLLLQATKDFDGKGVVKSDGCGMWLVKGMRTSLKGYQLLGTSFMRRRENGVEEPKGGLMADGMGLGKTLMMLANIVNGQPTRGSKDLRTTLLVASPALLTQWKSEIEQHTACNFKLIRYGTGTRIDSNHAAEILATHDIVLTTYTEIMKSYPKYEPPIELITAEQKMAWWQNVFEKQRGVLHRMHFLRVVLDEAQAIKNHMGRTSIACRAIIARHRWAISGTPISNSLTELYPYFKFLNVPYTGSFKIFKHNYCNANKEKNVERLLARLSSFMIRRTHADEMFGAPILKLPQANQMIYWCEFNAVERQIYDVVEHRFLRRINAMAEGGTIEKSYDNIFVMLLRLRQLAAHILMLQFVIEDLLEVEDIERLRKIVNDQKADKNSQTGRTILAIRKQLETLAAEEEKRSATKAAAARAAKAAGRKLDDEFDDDLDDETPGPESFKETLPDDEATNKSPQTRGPIATGGEFGKSFNFNPFLQSLKSGTSWERARANARCSQCNKQPRRSLVMSCGHLICSEPCQMDAVNEALAEGKEFATCKICKVVPASLLPCENEDGDSPEAVSSGTRSERARRQESKRKRRDREDIPQDWLESIGDDVLPSAKTIAAKSQVMNWITENPDVKVIIYTQFLAMIRIFSRICVIEGWKTEQYHGKMSFVARDKAIRSFADDPDTRILLASLRSGGLGLNLTMASKVIVIDPWWNATVEQQAFCRVFRIGQKEETFMSRLCVKHSIDSRLIKMQRRKQKEINSVIDGDKSFLKNLSVQDLMNLFGGLERDSDDDNDDDGGDFIFPDNPDPRGSVRADRDHEGFADDP